MNATVLPWPPAVLSQNARPHHFAKARATKSYRQIVGYHAQGAPKIDRPTVVIVPLVKPPQRRRDIDNIVGALKAAIDGLTDAGWWSDDSDLERLTIIRPLLSKRWADKGVLVCATEKKTMLLLERDLDTLTERAAKDLHPDEWLAMMTQRD